MLEPRIPILSSARPTLRPGVPPSTRKQERPRVPGSFSRSPVRAQSTKTPAWAPLVIHCFWPSITQLLPSFVAVVRIEPGSLPASGSESAKAPAAYSPLASFGLWSCFWASVPNVAMTSPTMFVTAIVTAVEAHARATSCIASA